MKITYIAFIIVALLSSSMSGAQELTPRAYWPAPTGTQVGTIGYSYVTGDTIPDPSLPLSGVDSKISTFVVGYRRTVSLLGRSTNLILEVPYSDGDTRADPDFGEKLVREYQGIGDISATISVNFMGAPSMTREEFAVLRQNPKPILGGSLKIVAPTGDYDSDRVINVGANRWALKAELGFIAPIKPKWFLELDLGAWIFQDNDDFLGFNKEQKPIAAVQAHLVHTFNPGFWMSLNASFYKGGRSTLGDRRLDDLQRDSKLGLTLVYPFARRHAFKVGYTIGSLNNTDEDFEVFFLSYSWVF
jgi:hypothetical protein